MNTYDIVLFLLMAVMVLSAVAQLYQPKFSMLGVLAVVAGLFFVIYTGANGDLNMLSIILFIGGLLFIVMELFIVGAVLGIIGSVMVVASFLLIGSDIGKMAVLVAIVLLLALIEWGVLVRVFGKRLSLLNKVVLTDSTSREAGYTSHDDRSYLIGRTAKTVTPLRPAGIISIDDLRIDAVGEGVFIDRDKEVIVTHVEGTRIVVREK